MPNEQDQNNQQAMQQLVELAKQQTEMSSERTKMATERTVLAAKRTYLNIERTLSVWIRTSLAIMIFGIAIDRFGLTFNGMTQQTGITPAHHIPSTIIGAIFVGISMFIAFASGVKFIGYSHSYAKEHPFPDYHHPALPIIYAFLTVGCGIVLLILMLSLG